jgi:hypothetical protein
VLDALGEAAGGAAFSRELLQGLNCEPKRRIKPLSAQARGRRPRGAVRGALLTFLLLLEVNMLL